MLKVTNKNDFDLKDRYNGEDYVFPAGKTVRCEELAAIHFFGLGDENKTPYLARQGWMQHTGELAKAMKILNNFTFEQVKETHAEASARQEQGKAPLQEETEDEGTADDVPESSATSQTRGVRRLLRVEQAPA